LAAGADPAWAAEAAIHLRVSGLLWKVLGLDTSGGSSAQLDDLRDDASRCRAQALLVFPRLGDHLLGPLAEAGLPALVFKGAALAGRYPAPGLRPMDDVDLMLPPEQHREAMRLLTERGWHVLVQQGEHTEVQLVHPQLPGLPVELHEQLAAKAERSSRMTASDIWAARRPIQVAGADAFGLAPEVEILALAAHAGKPFHTFDRLIWSVDIAVVIETAAATGRPLDWGAVEATADRVAARSVLAVALTHASHLGVDSPPRLREVPARGTRRAALEPLLDPEWPLLPRDLGTRNRLSFALIDDRRLRLGRAIADVRSEGLARLPRRVYNLSWRFGRRWWTLRRAAAPEIPPGQPPDWVSSRRRPPSGDPSASGSSKAVS
jgi:hypothetical protein